MCARVYVCTCVRSNLNFLFYIPVDSTCHIIYVPGMCKNSAEKTETNYVIGRHVGLLDKCEFGKRQSELKLVVSIVLSNIRRITRFIKASILFNRRIRNIYL